MKYIVTALLFLSLSAAFAQKADCKKWKNGNFVMYLDDGARYTIVRKGNKQIETNSKSGLILQLKVKWVDECTYELRRKKIIQNPQNEPELMGMVITVKILESYEDYCLIQVKTNRAGDIGYKDFFYFDKQAQ